MFARNKINIYDYTDYRKFLQDFYELEKSLDPTFSYRVFAAAVDVDASLLVKILQGKRHVSSKGIEPFVDFFRFKEAKAEYFREMVVYGKAKTDEDVRKHFEMLQKMRPAVCRELDEARYRYFQQWYYPAFATKYEAESATVSSEAKIVNSSGVSGTGYASLQEGSITFTGVTAETAGKYTLTIHYKAGDFKANYLKVNGATAGTIDFAATTGWSDITTAVRSRQVQIPSLSKNTGVGSTWTTSTFLPTNQSPSSSPLPRSHRTQPKAP